MSDESKGISFWERAAMAVSIVSLMIAGLSAYYSYEQVQIAREINERSSGRVPAEMKVEGVIPDSETLPQEFRKNIFGSMLTTMSFENPEKLISLNPRIVLKNVGKVPIEAVRIMVSFAYGISPENNKALILGDANKPILVEQVHKEDHVLDQKLVQGQVAIIPMARGLLHQMLQGQQGQNHATERYGEFTIKCYARVVGASSFDPTSDDKFVAFRLLWFPKGFGEEKCRKLIEKMQLRVEVMKPADEWR